jgi:hypothetical protein
MASMGRSGRGQRKILKRTGLAVADGLKSPGLFLERHHGLIVLAESGDSLQIPRRTGDKHDWTVAINGMACLRKIPLSAFVRGVCDS